MRRSIRATMPRAKICWLRCEARLNRGFRNGCGRTLLLEDGVVAVGEQFCAHGLGLVASGKGADLDMEQTVPGFIADDHVVSALLEGVDQYVRVFLAGNRGDLNHR